jgi:hypothetical protein
LSFDLLLAADAMAEDGYHPNAQSYVILGERGGAGISTLVRQI